MSQIPIITNKHDCFCCFLKKELEDNFSYYADAININNHFKHHMHEISNPPIVHLKETISMIKKENENDVDYLFFGE